MAGREKYFVPYLLNSEQLPIDSVSIGCYQMYKKIDKNRFIQTAAIKNNYCIMTESENIL